MHGDVAGVRNVESQPRVREARRECRLAARPVGEFDSGRADAQAVSEKLAQPRPGDDEAPTVAFENEAAGPLALCGAEQGSGPAEGRGPDVQANRFELDCAVALGGGGDHAGLSPSL